VEEQFYLFWAPVVKLLRHRLVPVVLVFTLLIAGLQILASFHIGTSDEQEETFVQTLRFHYMGVGALFAYALFSNSDRLLNSWVTAYWFQGLMLFALFYYYAVGTPPGIREVFLELPLAFLYAALIINVSLGPRRWMNLEWNPLSYLGKISYGIYMFHMPLDYCVRTVFTELHWIRPSLALGLAYGTILLVVTIAAAHVSYQYFEKRFLALAEHKA
jgi:peptidoglycan/LPS O-acetylase OafA/YrhL